MPINFTSAGGAFAGWQNNFIHLVVKIWKLKVQQSKIYFKVNSIQISITSGTSIMSNKQEPESVAKK